MLEFRYDTQLLIEGQDLDEDAVWEYFTTHFQGDCLLAVGGGDLIKTTSIPTSRGRCWSTAPPWGRSLTSWWRTWSARPVA